MLGIFLDIETTGLDSTRHDPIDLALKVVNLSTGMQVASYESVIKQSIENWEKRDLNSIQINGFTWEEILKGKTVAEVNKDVITLFSGLKIQRGEAVFICQNPAFDRGFFNQIIQVYKQEELNWPYHWLDLASMFWAMCVVKARHNQQPLPEKISLSKNEIAKRYHLPTEEIPHRAMKGVDHLIACYQAVLNV